MKTNLVRGFWQEHSQPKGIISLSSAPVRLHLGYWVQFGAPQDRGEVGKQERVQRRGTEMSGSWDTQHTSTDEDQAF